MLSVFFYVELGLNFACLSSFQGGFDVTELSDYGFAVGTHAERVAVDEWTHLPHGATVRKLSLSDEILWKLQVLKHRLKVLLEFVKEVGGGKSPPTTQPVGKEFILTQSFFTSLALDSSRVFRVFSRNVMNSARIVLPNWLNSYAPSIFSSRRPASERAEMLW